MYIPASGERLGNAPSPPEAAMARTELKTGPTQGVQPKLKVTPIRKALKNSLRFSSFFSWILFFLELLKIDEAHLMDSQ